MMNQRSNAVVESRLWYSGQEAEEEGQGTQWSQLLLIRVFGGYTELDRLARCGSLGITSHTGLARIET
jgi:hypothetical protein